MSNQIISDEHNMPPLGGANTHTQTDGHDSGNKRPNSDRGSVYHGMYVNINSGIIFIAVIPLTTLVSSDQHHHQQWASYTDGENNAF